MAHARFISTIMLRVSGIHTYMPQRTSLQNFQPAILFLKKNNKAVFWFPRLGRVAAAESSPERDKSSSLPPFNTRILSSRSSSTFPATGREDGNVDVIVQLKTHHNSCPCQLQNLALISLALASSATSAKTSLPRKSSNPTIFPSPPTPIAVWYYCCCKDRMASRKFLIHNLFPFKGNNKPFVARRRGSITTATKKHALNLFGEFIQLVRKTAARFLPMYIAKVTRHPPYQQHFLIFPPNLGEGLSWIPTRAPPVIFTDPRGVWRWEKGRGYQGLCIFQWYLSITGCSKRFLWDNG